MDFIGLQMLVTVKDPPGVRVKGTVSEVTPGQSLVLSNVFHLGSSKWIPRLTLEPNNIVDLAEYKDEVTPETFTAPGASSNGTTEDASLEASSPQGGRGKGWRQTPMLQSTSSFQPFKALKRNGKAGNSVLDNGWASEDVTEEMGEFDFEGELAKFDKQTIFNQMQKDDLVEESDRLVSHNRKAKPGTAGGKNYHHTENVLDIPAATPKMANDFWDSETDDAALGPERLSGRDVRSSQTLQMLNLENIAANEIGLTEDMMTENAGRGIAEVAVAALCDPAIQIRLGAGGISASAISHTSSIIVVLAGNNKSGIRAVAAARHLSNKGVNVLVCVVGIERERDLLEDMRQQVRIFKNLGGRIHNKIELFEQLRKTSHSSSATVTLIIDALLGLAISFEELRTGDQATVYELIEWANRNEAFTLAVDVPTGIDPSTGKVSIIDGGRLYVKPRYVVAMGAPKRGLLEAMAPPLRPSEEGNPESLSAPAADNDDWKLFIIDIGLGAAVWKKAGTKLRRGIDFDDKWVLEMRYQGATGQGEEPDY
ncbi:Enhancer of mRNA-decapping protein 3 like [Verticillium longisporum]|uniref:Enhancer of mRNA-decapping protein 3 n=1 Tax=Verticillium longisporum TaxID=100787 RepID=A0A8I2ZP31_VERLO|nr:Enhancer of mRNA-decapping protein 3 like [Verticillium longisporum]